MDSNNTGVFSDIPCPLGSKCDRPYCLFQHALDASQQISSPFHAQHQTQQTSLNNNNVYAFLFGDEAVRNNNVTNPASSVASSSAGPVIVQEDELTESDYVGYVAANDANSGNDAAMAFSNSTSSMFSSYGSSALFTTTAGQTSYVSTFTTTPFSTLNATQSLYAPEDPVLQQKLGNVNLSIEPTYSPVYTPSYPQTFSNNTNALNYRQHNAETASVNESNKLASDGPVYPLNRQILQPQYGALLQNNNRTNVEINAAASFGAFHTPEFSGSRNLSTNPVCKPYAFGTASTTITACQQPQKLNAAYHQSLQQPQLNVQQISNAAQHTTVQSNVNEPELVQIPYEPVYDATESHESHQLLDEQEQLHAPTRKREHESSPSSSTTELKPPERKKRLFKTSTTPAYVPTPIAELLRQKELNAKAKAERQQLEKEKLEKQRNKEPRNRSPGADDFSMLNRPSLPVDLADDEILNPQKNRLPLPVVVTKKKTDAKVTNKANNSSEMKNSAAASFSLSSRILAPPGKLKPSATTTVSKASNSKLDIVDNDVTTIVTENKKCKESVIKPTTNSVSEIASDGEMSSDDGDLAKQKLKKNATIKKQKLLTKMSENSHLDMANSEIAGKVKRSFKGSASIFDKSKKSLSHEKSSDEANKSPKKRINEKATEVYNIKRDRLGCLNATAKALADLDKEIAEKEQALKALIGGKDSASSSVHDQQHLSKKRKEKHAQQQKTPIWHKEKTLSKSNAEKLPVKKMLDQFSIDSLFEDVDHAAARIDKSAGVRRIEKSKNDNGDSDDSLIFHSSITPRLQSSVKSDKATNSTDIATTSGNSSAVIADNSDVDGAYGKSRLSALPTNGASRTVVKVKTKPPMAIDQMKNRFAALGTLNLASANAATLSSSRSDSKDLKDYGFSKGEARKARVGVFPDSLTSRKLTPVDMYDKKIAYSLRLKFLQKIYDEFKKLTDDDDDAISMATREEKAILDKISTRSAYASAITNSVTRIREMANNDGHTTASGGVSHMDVLAGRHNGLFTVGLKALGVGGALASLAGSSGKCHISEADFYARLTKKYLMTKTQMWENGYPRWSSDVLPGDGQNRVVEIQPYMPVSIKHGYLDDSVMTRVCNRCGKEYRLNKDGEYMAVDNSCVYHWGKAWKKRINGALDSRYTCCDQDLSVKGCVAGELHVTETKRRSTLADFRETPRPFGVGDPRSRKVYALDCEMVYGVWGPLLARLSVVDVLDELVLDEIVQPESEVVDANTRFSGLTKEQLEKAKCTFNEARERLFELVNQDTILIGHSLESDLKALRIVHNKIVDTSIVFPHRLGPPKKRALKTITCEVLQKIIQEDVAGHDSKEDASACMKIMLHKVEKMD